ncbi:hypothetical protein [Bacillus phage BC-T25]|nr:hypothetical protein [Bacillus phage BC-T25]
MDREQWMRKQTRFIETYFGIDSALLWYQYETQQVANIHLDSTKALQPRQLTEEDKKEIRLANRKQLHKMLSKPRRK